MVSAALADKGVYLDGATHLFLPFVTHSSATRQRSEMLRDRPSPVVPFTVPNRESVRGPADTCHSSRTNAGSAGAETPAQEEGTRRHTEESLEPVV